MNADLNAGEFAGLAVLVCVAAFLLTYAFLAVTLGT